MHSEFNGIKFTDSDVVNLDDAPWLTGCANNRPWLMHEHGAAVAVVFAETFQDALDIVADKGRLDRFKVAPKDLDEYGTDEGGIDGDGLDYLGNIGEPYDLENLSWSTLPTPRFSFVTLFNASKQER